jgi:hypothetical protein
MDVLPFLKTTGETIVRELRFAGRKRHPFETTALSGPRGPDSAVAVGKVLAVAGATLDP